MGRPKWITDQRLSNMKDSFQLIPSPIQKSKRDYRVPPTLKDDFKRLLQHDVPNTNYTFQLIQDWFEAQAEGYEPHYIRAQQTPIDWKSKIGNSDMSTNIKVDVDTYIRKGDIAVRQDGKIFMLSWNVTNHPNNNASQIVECNDILTFTRQYNPPVDEYGYELQPDDSVQLDEYGRIIIVKNMPVSSSQYNGRPDFVIAQSQPGVTANHLVNMYIQWNCMTKNIRIDDYVVIGPYTYSVHNVFDGQVDMYGQYGCLYIQLRRLPGGGINE